MNKKSIPLCELQEGEIGEVKSLELSGAIRRRLLDLGMILGTRVRCLQKAPAGTPIAYDIRGAVIALRGVDAEKIWVTA